MHSRTGKKNKPKENVGAYEKGDILPAVAGDAENLHQAIDFPRTFC